MTRAPDFEGEFHLFAGARNGPAYWVTYRPQHEVHENYSTSGYHEYEGRDSLEPGETIKVKVWLITPQAYPHCLWEGRELRILEGAKHVGNVRVTKLLNPTLRVKPEEYQSVWVEPFGVKIDSPYKGWEND